MITIHRLLLGAALLVGGALAADPIHPVAAPTHRAPEPLDIGGPHTVTMFTRHAPHASHLRPSIPLLTVVASDFAYQAPDTIHAGLVRMRLRGAGREPHILQLVRLASPHRAEDYLEYREAHGRDPVWAVHAGGPTVVFGTDSTEVLLDLAPGEYVMLCPVQSRSDHVAHAAKGMVRALTVLPSPARRVREPRSDLTLTLVDYGFDFSTWPKPGRRIIRVENQAAQPHEVALVRLEPGMHVADVLRWAKDFEGPMPGRVVGGTTGLSRGEIALLDVTFAPGTYAVLCFVPDAKDGRSHVAHGMTAEFTVR
jgi:hypothetical protein